MSKNQVIKEYLLKYGKSHSWVELGKRYEVSPDVVRGIYRRLNNSSTPTIDVQNNNLDAQNYIGELQETIINLIEKTSNNNSEIVTYSSNKPLSPSELANLAQVDNINTFINKTWLKSHKNGLWTYSIDIKYNIPGFYSKDELSNRLKEIIPKSNDIFKQDKIISDNNSLFIYIADDHCGLELDSIYDKTHTKLTYDNKLNKIASIVLNMGNTYDKVFIINLGDVIDGFNKFTTRGGHALESFDNKTQFDTYVNSRIKFYNTILGSNISNTYEVLNIQNSNHSGNYLAYMADRAIELYLSQIYTNTTFTHSNEFIHIVNYGIHSIALTHGKDEKHMKSPFPLNLDFKADNFFFEYFDTKGYSPSKYELRVVKGDLHKYNVNQGKFGMYINVPSISSGSNWIEHNFGKSKSGALLEIINKDHPDIISVPIWFE